MIIEKKCLYFKIVMSKLIMRYLHKFSIKMFKKSTRFDVLFAAFQHEYYFLKKKKNS